jgi:hypothetical protein
MKMRRILTHTAFATALAVLGLAQTPAGSQQATGAASETKTFHGVLMDASCQAIQTRETSSTQTSRTGPTGAVGPTGTIGTDSTDTTGATSARTAIEHTGAPGKTSSAVQRRETDKTVSGTTASGSSSVTTYSGQTGAPTTADPASAATEPETGTTRSRAEETAGGNWTTVREKYKDCKVTPNTRLFALMSDGQLYLLDDQQAMLRGMTGSGRNPGSNVVTIGKTEPEWRTVTVKGKLEGNRIQVDSVQ